MVLVLPARHIQTDFADDGLGDADVDPIDPRQVDTADAVEFAPEVELRRMTACLSSAFDVRPCLRGSGTGRVRRVGRLVGEDLEMLLQGLVAFLDPLAIRVVQRHFLLEDE